MEAAASTSASAGVVLLIRVGRGLPIKRTVGEAEPSFETVFFLKEGPRACFNPYAVMRTHAQYLEFYERVEKYTTGFFKFDTLFDKSKPAGEAEYDRRTLAVADWSIELLEKLKSLASGRRMRVAEIIFHFYDVHESNDKSSDKEDLIDCRKVIREKILAGYTHSKPAGNARFAKVKRKEVRPLRKYEKFVANKLKADQFQNKFNPDDGTFYLFNPFTGETIITISADGTNETLPVDRHVSIWKVPDPFPELASTDVSSVLIFPVLYESRQATRIFRGWKKVDEQASRDAAATHIAAVSRGAIVRARLRVFHRQRFIKEMDKESGYYYFINTVTQQTSWTKPRLAGPFDIQERPLDLRNDVHTAESSYCDGPVHARRLGKKKMERYRPPKLHDDLREASFREPKMLNLEETPFRILVLWIDENVTKFARYQPLRELYDEQDWMTLVQIFEKRSDDAFAQLYCLHAFSRMEVTEHDGDLSAGPSEALSVLVPTLQQWMQTKKYGCTHMMFLGTALLRLLEQHSARVAFFSTKHLENDEPRVGMSGEAEEYINKRLDVFCKLLRTIPVEVFEESVSKGMGGSVIDVTKPTQRGVDFAEVLLQIIGVLLHERDTRELVGEKLGKYIVYALRLCISEPFCLTYGLRCIYNCCYMSPLGWENMHYRTDSLDLLKEIRKAPLGGDLDVLRDLRRCELALAENGWLGKVESMIEMEMKEKERGFVAAFASKNNSPEASPSKEGGTP